MWKQKWLLFALCFSLFACRRATAVQPSSTRDVVTTQVDVQRVVDTGPGLAREDVAKREACDPVPACDLAPPTVVQSAWRHNRTALATLAGTARHRGRDLLLHKGDPQWAIAKFAYGLTDSDLKDEDVDVFLLRDCKTWERLGTFRTTREGQHATVYDVEDRGGRVYLNFADAWLTPLGVGRHRVHFVVRGDLSTADQYIEVLPDLAQRYVVTDVDGTLTESEMAAFWTELGGPSPEANPGSAQALWELSRKGYVIVYLTARPEWIAGRTQQWLRDHGYPPGIVRTTLGFTGAVGAVAQAFKTTELAGLRTLFQAPPAYAFGNTESDAAAYRDSGVRASNRYLYKLSGDVLGGVRLTDYVPLSREFSVLSAECR